MASNHSVSVSTENSGSSGRLLIDLESITVRLWERLILQDTCWQIREGQQWAVLGLNASGKTALGRVICGELPCCVSNVLRLG